MTIQTLINAWARSGRYQSINPPVTKADIQAAEAKIGARLPQTLREVYQFSNGGWVWEVAFDRLLPLSNEDHGSRPTGRAQHALTNMHEWYIKDRWPIPQEVRVFGGADNGMYGIWLPEINNPIFSHPIIEFRSLTGGGDDCIGVVGTNLTSFLHSWSVYHLIYQESLKLADQAYLKLEAGKEELSHIQTAQDMLQVPQSLRLNHFDKSQYKQVYAEEDVHLTELRRWADPKLPDPSGTAYSQRYTIADLKDLFGET